MSSIISDNLSNKHAAIHEAGHVVAGWVFGSTINIAELHNEGGGVSFTDFVPMTEENWFEELSAMIVDFLSGMTANRLLYGDEIQDDPNVFSYSNRDDVIALYKLIDILIDHDSITLENHTPNKEEWIGLYLSISSFIIEEYSEQVNLIAEELLNKQSLNNGDVIRIIGESPNRLVDEFIDIGWDLVKLQMEKTNAL